VTSVNHADPDLVEALSERYAIERELGRGGMATVYLARDLKHKRPVALKVLHPELGAALGAERFLREIETTASFNDREAADIGMHPSLLPRGPPRSFFPYWPISIQEASVEATDRLRR
jgi:serine/threonine protein kinase